MLQLQGTLSYRLIPFPLFLPWSCPYYLQVLQEVEHLQRQNHAILYLLTFLV
uniref:Uncharacterized protein n=1 Tax=uncultured marine virus TaxID=186617 RepID=A0A0F7L0L9_9VIRU|nr:hypothetical protein B739_1374 [uncultured marine virus]